MLFVVSNVIYFTAGFVVLQDWQAHTALPALAAPHISERI